MTIDEFKKLCDSILDKWSVHEEVVEITQDMVGNQFRYLGGILPAVPDQTVNYDNLIRLLAELPKLLEVAQATTPPAP